MNEHEHETMEQRRARVVAQALANDDLMRQEREAQAAEARGERAVPWSEVMEEARRRRGELPV